MDNLPPKLDLNITDMIASIPFDWQPDDGAFDNEQVNEMLAGLKDGPEITFMATYADEVDLAAEMLGRLQSRTEMTIVTQVYRDAPRHASQVHGRIHRHHYAPRRTFTFPVREVAQTGIHEYVFTLGGTAGKGNDGNPERED